MVHPPGQTLPPPWADTSLGRHPPLDMVNERVARILLECFLVAAVKSFDAIISISGNFVLNPKMLYVKRKERHISCETETALACLTKCAKYMTFAVLETSLPSHVVLASGISAKIWCGV